MKAANTQAQTPRKIRAAGTRTGRDAEATAGWESEED